MPEPSPRTGPRHEPGRIHERAADPAEAVNRPLEPKSVPHELAEADEPGGDASGPRPDPHHSLNTPVGEPDAIADSDPYREPTADDERDTASGTRGAHEGAEDT